MLGLKILHVFQISHFVEFDDTNTSLNSRYILSFTQ